MAKPKKSGTSRAWHDNWWAGVDLDAVANGDTSDQKSRSTRDRESSVRWAAQQRSSGGFLRKLLG